MIAITEKICIGIHIYCDFQRLAQTLTSIYSYTRPPFQLLLLLDGPDEETQLAIEQYQIPHSGTRQAKGAAACFNRLVCNSDADVFIFLENGALVGPDWLEYLLLALVTRPSHGLAGPSTNRCWNEQCIFPDGKMDDISQIAEQAAYSFGRRWRTLEPLYSLADFCYVVKKQVVEAIGAANEGYGSGPCWEMDYNIRAKRAGFEGVWACGSYVYRCPVNYRRNSEEKRLFTENRQRYQDNFCALKLLAQKQAYASHCYGDVCQHFAPKNLIKTHINLSHGTNGKADFSQQTTPLVSCILPTCNRPQYLTQSIRYFQQQDYHQCELIIVYDRPEDLPKNLPDDERIRYLEVFPKQSIGHKRNRACEIARGDIIAQWDDDDWYAPARLRMQIAPLLANVAEISALYDTLFFVLDTWEFWRCSRELYQNMFVENVHGGTLVYRKWVWQRLSRYSDASLREDVDFMCGALKQGARLWRIPGIDLYLYLRHGTNSWSFRAGEMIDPNGWQKVPEPRAFAVDNSFYRSIQKMKPAKPRQAIAQMNSRPLATCIMPTADRQYIVLWSIRNFLHQNYKNSELLIIDDGIESIEKIIPRDLRIRYIRLNAKRYSLGAKRNLACENAKGEIIVHWDDDDWYAPDWLTHQIHGLTSNQADICGLDKVVFFDPLSRDAWQYIYPPTERPWVHGGTLCYTKSFWSNNRFMNIDVGEDCQFVWSNQDKNLTKHNAQSSYIALIHPNNTSPKRTADIRWHKYSVKDVERLLGNENISFLKGVLQQTHPNV